MQIYGPFRVSAAQQSSPAQRIQPQQADPTTAKPATQSADQLDLSSGVNRLDSAQIAGSGEIRTDRVADIRRQIADGNYETPEKLDAALDRLLDQFA